MTGSGCKFYHHNTEGHDPDPRPDPGQKGPFIGQVITGGAFGLWAVAGHDVYLSAATWASKNFLVSMTSGTLLSQLLSCSIDIMPEKF